jgi:hypothetical protein
MYRKVLPSLSIDLVDSERVCTNFSHSVQAKLANLTSKMKKSEENEILTLSSA